MLERVATLRRRRRSRRTTVGADERAARNQGQMRLLLIEDDQPLAHSLSRGLEAAGDGVDATSDGESGLSLAQRTPYDVIALDPVLPRQQAAGRGCTEAALAPRARLR